MVDEEAESERCEVELEVAPVAAAAASTESETDSGAELESLRLRPTTFLLAARRSSLARFFSSGWPERYCVGHCA